MARPRRKKSLGPQLEKLQLESDNSDVDIEELTVRVPACIVRRLELFAQLLKTQPEIMVSTALVMSMPEFERLVAAQQQGGTGVVAERVF